MRTKSPPSTSSIADLVTRARNAIEREPSASAGRIEVLDSAVARRRKPPQHHREYQDENQSHPVDGERNSEIGDAESEAVEPAAGIARAQDAERDAEYRGEEHCRAGEEQRLGKALADVLDDRALVMYELPKSPRSTPPV